MGKTYTGSKKSNKQEKDSWQQKRQPVCFKYRKSGKSRKKRAKV
jgi:hypothetical protein